MWNNSKCPDLSSNQQLNPDLQSPTHFHLAKLTVRDALGKEDQNVPRVRDSMAHAPHRWVLQRFAGLRGQRDCQQKIHRNVLYCQHLGSSTCKQNNHIINVFPYLHSLACSMSSQKDAPKKRSEIASRRFCTASWALDCLWPWRKGAWWNRLRIWKSAILGFVWGRTFLSWNVVCSFWNLDLIDFWSRTTSCLGTL